MWGMTLRVVRDEGGVRALYRGLVPTSMGVAPYVGTYKPAFVVPYTIDCYDLQALTLLRMKPYVDTLPLLGRVVPSASSHAVL